MPPSPSDRDIDLEGYSRDDRISDDHISDNHIGSGRL
jgi:hypothetical protein